MEENKKLDPVKKLFKEAFEFYLNRFWKLTGIILMPIMAVILLSTPFITLHFLGINVFTSIGILAIIFFVIFFLIFNFWSGLALIYAIKEEFGILRAFQQSRHNFFSFLRIVILTIFIVFGGFMMGIVPGIIFSTWFMFAVYLLIDQGLTGMNALLRSKEYVKGYWWGIIGRSLAPSLFLILINFFVYLVISLIINKDVGELARNIANLILMPFSVVFMFFLYRNLVALKPELAAAPVTAKKGFFVFSGILGVLAILSILILLVAVGISYYKILSQPMNKNLNASAKISVNEYSVYDNPEFRFRFRYPAGFISKLPYKLNTQSSMSTVALYLRIGVVLVRVDTSEHEEMLPLIKSDIFKEESIITQENKIYGIKEERPLKAGVTEKNLLYSFNLNTPPELLSEIHKGVNPLRDKLILRFIIENFTPQTESILEKIVSTLEFY